MHSDVGTERELLQEWFSPVLPQAKQLGFSIAIEMVLLSGLRAGEEVEEHEPCLGLVFG